MTREDVFGALFALAPSVSWGGGETFQYTSRRLKVFADIPAFPALCQAEFTEASTQATRLPYKRTWTASWFIYHQSGKDAEVAPTSTNNAILDAVEAALVPQPNDPGFPDGRLTLGGLVHHCWIEGPIYKNPGDLDDQALLIVPIHLLVP